MSENKAVAEVTKTPSYLEWFRVEELGYEINGPSAAATTLSDTDRLCFHCATPHTKLFKCANLFVKRIGKFNGS